MEISQNFVALSEYMNFNSNILGGKQSFPNAEWIAVMVACSIRCRHKKKGESDGKTGQIREVNSLFSAFCTHLIIKTFFNPLFHGKNGQFHFNNLDSRVTIICPNTELT